MIAFLGVASFAGLIVCIYLAVKARKRNMPTKSYIIGACVCFALTAVLMGIDGILNPTDDKDPIAVVHNETESELTEPSETPLPSEEPTPTEEAMPEVAPITEELIQGNNDDYLNFMATTSYALSDALSGISTQSLSMGENPTLMYDENWQLRTAMYIVQVNQYCDDFLDYDLAQVPDDCLKAHELIILGCEDLKLSMEYYVAGIDELDSEKLGSAIEYMTSGSNYFGEATSQLPK